MKARTQLAAIESWVGGSKSRRGSSTWSPGIGSADADLLWDLQTLRARSRDQARNSPIAGAALNTATTNVVGTGLSLQARLDREALGLSDEEASAWERSTEREWRLWCESPECDVTRTQNFYQLQALVFRSVLESGDAFTVLPSIQRVGCPYSLKVQILEADRVSQPNFKANTDTFAEGVEMDEYGAPVNYWISKSHPGSISPKAQAWSALPAYTKRGQRRVLHHLDRKRPGQTRGIPFLAPVLEALKQLERYTEAELMAAVVSGLFTVFVETATGRGMNLDPLADETGASSSDKDAKLGYGAVVEMKTGDKVHTATPGRPNALFDPFVTAIIRQIGAILEIPGEVLTKTFLASYSASRASLLEAWRFFRCRREWLASTFCQPIYEVWMDEAVSSGRIQAPGYFRDPALRKAYLNAEWIGDSPGQIDPLKEAAAAEKRMDIGLTTLAEETILATGKDWEANLSQRKREKLAHQEAGLPLGPSTAPSSPPADPPGQDNEDDEDAA
jgi:lambda family phage portal protein